MRCETLCIGSGPSTPVLKRLTDDAYMKLLQVICRILVWVIAICALPRQTYAQVIHLGVKTGAQLSWVRSDDKNFREIAKIHPVPGYNAGVVAAFKVKERFYLHTEYLYSTKGKKVKGRIDEMLEDRIKYNYIDVPILYNIHFRGSLGGMRKFQWYAGAGPLFSYWLGGKGKINSDEFAENNFEPFEYHIRFGERGEDIGETNIIYMKEVKRLQLGFNFGGGIMLEPSEKNKIMVDLRFEFGHTWIGTPTSADYVLPVTYDDNLKARNMGLRFSLMYLIQTNLDKKVRNKGKSNLKSKG
jgi:hypothetical protein